MCRKSHGGLLCAVHGCLALWCLVALVDVTVAQDMEWFREIGLDLNVDPQAVVSDAGGLVDVNLDGWIDVFTGAGICLNNGLLDGILQPFSSADSAKVWGEGRFADFDNDGDVDIYSTMQVSAQDYLFANNGDLTFSDVSAAKGLVYPDGKFSLACCWADYDNDGWVDLLVGMCLEGGPGSGIYLWKNQGGQGFVNVAPQMGLTLTHLWHGAVWADFDNDGDQDFFLAGGRRGDALFRNDGTKFENIASATKTSGEGVIGLSRFAAWGDYDNDGRLDLYVCDDEKRNRLFRNTGAGVWPDVARDLHVDNLDPTGWVLDASATAVWGDYDNDGDLDLFLASQGGAFTKKSENRLYRNDGAAGFVEIAQTSAIADQGQTHYAASFGDIDNDGDLDLYVQVGPTQIPPGLGGGVDLLFENLKGSENNWLEFRLTGRQSNRSAIGARIRCVADDLSQIREVQGGSGYNSMNPFQQHFGFGRRTVVDSVIIRWPSGMVDVLTAVPVNQIIAVTEGSFSGITTPFTMPEQMSIEGNYPNPFNARTVIRFTLPELSRTQLTIVNISGRRVRTLINGRMLSGVQEVRWDGRDDSGEPVASGIYLCRLTVGDRTVVHSMAYVK